MQKKLATNIKAIQEKLGNSNELIVKEIISGNTKCAIVYMLGLSDTELLSKFVISPLIENKQKIKDLNFLSSSILTLSETSTETDDKKIISFILKGKGILLVDDFDKCLILAIDKFKERAIEEPPTSTVLKGPRSGFVENLKTNL